ncbi:hypothetical protein AVEN_13299-1, partial [Araneus ventricosus]
VSIHSKVAQSTAMKVLSNHSKGNLPFSNNSISDASSTNPSEPSKKSSDSSSSAISSYETKAAALQRLATQKALTVPISEGTWGSVSGQVNKQRLRSADGFEDDIGTNDKRTSIKINELSFGL